MWALHGLFVVAALSAAGVILDRLLGELRRWHPLVGFGRLANAIEQRLNRPAGRRWVGLCAWALAVLPPVALVVWIGIVLGRQSLWLAAGWQILLLYFCLGLRSLGDHVLPIAKALKDGDLAAARALTARIVSRDTSELDESDLAKAAVESVLENGNDAVFGTLFWFVVSGGAGALLFRLSNTLDAMWGYRTPRLLVFGCAAARIDDALNWIPARLTALSYGMLGNWEVARQCWRTQARAWSSPNAGPVMAAGAGALELSLGGPAVYHGALEDRPLLGAGPRPMADDIDRAWSLVQRTTWLWLTVLVLIAAGVGMMRLVYLMMGGSLA
ncbi:adenosylcobinamide-phosphate synthase [Herbaspirillum sp. Sphag1AN]|uniref:adenosylcobinamide-phosphate synthase CbiB n=1 Tax=unclassified Herbaspirillum TaxID=2624150 RepID=UPI001610F8F1|nr:MULTISPECIES: adenosylcobinamide-phosphate synthase CbiB [unclassified Herbaspirillum]MBB3213167.1 adenosylcobinamide-phosphate synthase [Herbaspirillum sp. Sphag1AN]MBB3246364.1 adenosylcobinamide-phosphate synthase [Herbaspirillum sp. Sphag64]